LPAPGIGVEFFVYLKYRPNFGKINIAGLRERITIAAFLQWILVIALELYSPAM
jgi:hypothetical protein